MQPRKQFSVRRSHGVASILMATLVATVLMSLVACGGSPDADAKGAPGGRGASGRPGGGGGWGSGAPAQRAAVPVEVTVASRRDLSSFIETNGVLEAEREVDLVARAAGPITRLSAEENQFVREGQLLAQLDQDQALAALELSQVEQQEAQLSFERIEALHEASLISREEFEQSRARLDSSAARLSGDRIQVNYTEVRAPFDGLIVRRYVKFAESVAANQPLFRLSDFSPLLCVIQVPERSLSLLKNGQVAYLTVEGYPDKRFEAKVLRISPVVESDSGTVRVTLEVGAQEQLRPGMFASVFLETEKRQGALVLPKQALSLDSVGDAVYVVEDGVARRRELKLGVRDGEFVEVLSGVNEGEAVVSIGQDGLADETPVQVLGQGASAGQVGSGGPADSGTAADSDTSANPNGGPSAPGAFPGSGDPSKMTPERLEQVKERMRSRGLSEEQIKARLEQFTQGRGGDQ